MGSRKRRGDREAGATKTRKTRQIVDNLPANGNAKPAFPNKVEAGELAIVSGAVMEVEGLKKKETALQRELTLTSADLIRRGDDLTVRLRKMHQKYGIRRGFREVDMKTGMVMDVTQPVDPLKPAEPPKSPK